LAPSVDSFPPNFTQASPGPPKQRRTSAARFPQSVLGRACCLHQRMVLFNSLQGFPIFAACTLHDVWACILLFNCAHTLLDDCSHTLLMIVPALCLMVVPTHCFIFFIAHCMTTLPTHYSVTVPAHCLMIVPALCLMIVLVTLLAYFSCILCHDCACVHSLHTFPAIYVT